MNKFRRTKTVLALGISQALAVGNAHGATISVGSGCTLVEAVRSANSDNANGNGCVDGNGADVINFTQVDANYLTFSAINSNLLPNVISDITINGSTGTFIRVSRAGSKPARIVSVLGSGHLRLNNINFSNGLFTSAQPLAKGAGIYVGADASLTANNVSLSNNENSSYGDGGAIWSAGTINATNLQIANNKARRGGGVFIAGGTAIFRDSNITGNRAIKSNGDPAEGGGLFASNNAQVEFLDGSDIVANSASGSGGGIYARAGAQINVTGSMLRNNTSSVNGGSIFLTGTRASINNSTISRSQANIGGAISAVETKLDITNNSRILSNYATSAGGAIQFVNETLSIDDSSIYANSTGSSFAGAISAYASEMRIKQTTLRDNLAPNFGGAIVIQNNTQLNLTACSLENNSAASGGGLLALSNSFVKLVNTNLSGNRASSGNGGALYVGNADLNSVNSTFIGNYSAALGGAIIVSNNTDKTVKLQNNIISNNVAASSQGNELHIRNSGINTVESNVLGSANSAYGSSFYTTPSISLANNLIMSSDRLNIPPEQIASQTLANNGGTTQSHLIPAGSPAQEAGTTNVCPPVDQRGKARDTSFMVPIVTASDSIAVIDLGGSCDIGSIEN